MIGPVGLEHRPGSPQLCSAVDTSPYTVKNQDLSSPPLKGEATAYSLSLLFRTAKGTQKGGKERKSSHRCHHRRNTKPEKHEHAEDPAEAESHARDARHRLHEGNDARNANNVVPRRDGFSLTSLLRSDETVDAPDTATMTL
jgi:hypothetical protein